MLELKITLEDVDYATVLSSLIPLVIKNKILAGAAASAVSAKLNSLSPSQQDEYVAAFLSDNKEKIAELLDSAIKNKGMTGSVRSFNAKKV